MEGEKTLLEKIKASYRRGELQHTHYVHYFDPDQLETTTDVLRRDQWTVDHIKDLEHEIEMLKEYRLLLSERYNYLESVTTVPVILLKREKNYYANKVYYYLIEYKRILDTGKDIQVSSKKYPGSERRQAIADYNAYIKSHPGIIAEKDIEKGKWER